VGQRIRIGLRKLKRPKKRKPPMAKHPYELARLLIGGLFGHWVVCGG
jgi:hypothetical protein